ncbi:MAG: hypothetical protein A2138_25850 [Deltaproteobacteria bacterium RBG_16_71_12]|nr:MAG: hypothetical protein A2138_25850 [Deltaproteobacteria bacterium RBG_16_71_12]
MEPVEDRAMARLALPLLLVLPVIAGCLDERPDGAAARGRGRPGPGLTLTDLVHNARRDGPRLQTAGDPRSALEVEQVRYFDPPTGTLEGWPRGDGDVDELGGAQQWARTVGAAGWDSVQQVVRFDADEVAVIGWIEGSVDFGGVCGVVKPGPLNETEDFRYASYVARFNDAGACQWIDSFDSDDGWPTAVAVDAAHNIYVVGMFDTEVRFGGGLDLATSGRAEDVFIARWTNTGALDWTRSITGTSDTWAYDAAVIEDGDGADLVLAGSFDGTAELDGATSLTASGGYDMLVARWSSTGDVVFATSFGAEGLEEAYAVGVLGADVVVGGYFDSSSLPVGAREPLANQGSYDAALILLNGAGAPLWARSFGADGGEWIADLTVTGGDIAVVGGFTGTMSVAGLPELTATGTAAFIARFDGAGAGLFAHAASSANGGALFTSVRAGPGGDLYASTVIDGDTAFGATMVSPAPGAWSIVTVRYAGAGAETPLWVSRVDRSGAMTYPVLDLSDSRVVLAADQTDNGGDMALYGLGL